MPAWAVEYRRAERREDAHIAGRSYTIVGEVLERVSAVRIAADNLGRVPERVTEAEWGSR